MSVEQFGVVPDGTDATPGVLAALQYCQTHNVSCLVFPNGRYDFFPDFAKDLYLYLCNNDAGLKRIVFPLIDFEEFTIDGQGSEFVFHGLINPFFVSKSSSITLKEFSVDFERSFHSEGRILSVDDEGMDLHIPEHFPYKICGGLLRFVGNDSAVESSNSAASRLVYGSNHLLEFDTTERKTAFMAKDYYFNGTASYPAREIGKRTIRLSIKGLTGKPGNTLVFGPNHRNYPAFVLNESRDICVESITIHHAGGMGILAQLCHNVHIDKCRVTPSKGRILSTTADATHFANCTGLLSLTDNLFENQGDDATNIHGVYVQIARMISSHELLVRLVHPQQIGFDFIHEGLEIEFVDGRSLQTIGEGKVIRKKPLNKEFTQIVLEKPIPEGLTVGDAIAANRDYPEVRISGNTIRNNRARGMLLNCRGKTRVENNYFHTPGAAILFEGDASYWFEQGGVSDCVIQGNTFDNCLFGVWGKGVIDVQAGIHEKRESSRYNRNIVIKDNRFIRGNQSPLLHAFCVDNLQWRDNQIEASRIDNPESPFIISFCSNVSIKDELYCETDPLPNLNT
ncbi:right-handed parallel beta-helix repeat-containing protein [Puniceicoccales bacterium CK1056]|uniref:Right-handed parallel beta-helix repeat-containing protein n=1 Tax=Oceanipulchritudo coccoides TaxID=2706888 RepID=A0A6B2M1A2_9BACT|nr:right-handed parallel beta-helix repeat-containing protein [Oceanipulchritudo coccoides]NDV61555.1 right-handed parallel beta-helix repeat-containing protein [Oceanipulchritudo coccoides]